MYDKILLLKGLIFMDELNLGNQFLSNGFTITNATLFSKELKSNNMEPYDLLNKLLTLQKLANSNNNIVTFSKSMLDKIDAFTETIQKSIEVDKIDAKIIEKINTDLANISQNFGTIKNYLKAEAEMLECKQSVLDIKKEIYNLGKNTQLDAQSKTAKTLQLQEELKSHEEALNKANQTCQEQKAIYNKSVQGTNVSDFKNSLLNSINTLDTDIKDLALPEDSTKKLTEIIQEMRNETAYYALDNLKSQNEFDALCQRYGLKYDAVTRDTIPTTNDKVAPSDDSKAKKESKEEPKPENDKTTSVPLSPEYSETKTDTASLDGPKEPDDVEVLAPPTPEEPKIKVVAKKACKWLNKHKKQILIAVGISLLIAATIVALQYLIPAITAMLKTGEVASLSGAMLNNGALWHGAIASEQAALHSANTALASAIQTMTGSEAIFNVGSGVWTIGGLELGKFAAAATANAAAAASTAASISNGILGLGISGLGLTGLGAIIKEKSPAYENINQKLKELEKNIAYFTHEEFKNNIDILVEAINTNENLTEDEKKRLVKKANKLIDKSLTYIDNNTETLEEGKGR